MSHRTVRARAKINLGLEIIGRRSDGYHEIRTVLCNVSLSDTLLFEPSGGTDDVIVMEGGPDIPESSNLVAKAMRALRCAGALIPAQRITVVKRIPAAAGLGGASSDAAATIRAFAGELSRAGVEPDALATTLGSDVPFFLGGPVALAAGRGEKLTPLIPPADNSWAVLATPTMSIQDKTRTMYKAINKASWSDGSKVLTIAQSLPSLPIAAPYNVFERAMLHLYPELDTYRKRLARAGFPWVALTGAGPTFYTLVSTREMADMLGGSLEADGIEAHVARLCVTDEN
jgi:4-diphosphocytidyl-2-C-methyl-D-erythritol kinase